MHLSRSGAAAFVFGLLLLPWNWTTAQAEHEGPPKVLLRTTHNRQLGDLQSFCWTARGTEIGEYFRACESAEMHFPSASLRPGRSRNPTFYLQRAIPPVEYSFTYWTRLRRGGSPRGVGHELRATLVPVLRNGRAGYGTDLNLPKSSNHYYVRFFARWPDEGGSFSDESADWTFHVART